MPFDRAVFPEKPTKPKPGDNMAIFVILLVTITMLVMPISMAALVDAVNYFTAK